MALAWLSASFQSVPLLPTSKLGPSGADSQVCRLVYVLGPLGLSIELSYEARSFSCHLNPHRFPELEVLRLYFPALDPGLCGLSCSPVVPPNLSTCECGTTHSASHCLALSTSQCLAHPGPPAATLPSILSTLDAHLHPSYQSE